MSNEAGRRQYLSTSRPAYLDGGTGGKLMVLHSYLILYTSNHRKNRKPKGELMKRLFLATAVLLVSSSWMLAQNNSLSQQPADKSQTATSDQKGHTIEGCLTGAANTFTLTDAQGRPYQLTGDTKGLNENVGHQVRLEGSAGNAGPNPYSVWGTQATFGVKKVTSLSDSCK
jgi:hypothetical protein